MIIIGNQSFLIHLSETHMICLLSQISPIFVLLIASTPTIDGIDYSQPKKYLEIAPSLGSIDAIREQGVALRGGNDQKTVRNVVEWVNNQLKYDGEKAYSWRNFDDVNRDKCYGGCADQGIACGVLLKAAGIPALWVKTMDVDWIWDFKRNRPFNAWSGHVFLEIYIDGEWVLLDPGSQQIYRGYSTKSRILPGNRFAYHKGNDPKEMIMSLQWDEWKEQTTSYFKALDESLLPVDSKSSVGVVPQVFIAGNDPGYKVLTSMAQEKGWAVRNSFNNDFARFFAMAKGQILLIETHRQVPIVPLEEMERAFPGVSTGLANPNGLIEIGGTTIMFVELARALDSIDR